MALVCSDVGEARFLSYLVNKATPTDMKLRLFTNDYTPDEDSDFGNFSEATEDGYAAITLTGSNWTIATVAGITTASYPEQTFDFEEAADVYGYFCTDTSDNFLYAERFTGAPFSLPSGGGDIAITPKISLD